MVADYTVSDQTEVIKVSAQGRRTRDVPMPSPLGVFGVVRGRQRTLRSGKGRETRPPSLTFETLARMEPYPVIETGIALITAPIIAAFARATATSKDEDRALFVQRTLIDSGVLYEGVRTALHNQTFGVAIHEAEWRVVDLLIVLEPGRCEVVYGNYDTYELLRANRDADSIAAHLATIILQALRETMADDWVVQN